MPCTQKSPRLTFLRLESVPSEVTAVANKVAITRLYIRVVAAGYGLCRIFRDAVKVRTQMRLAEVPDRVQGCKIVIPTIRRQFKPVATV